MTTGRERVLQVETTTHGRVLIDEAATSRAAPMIVGFHGYGQTADDMLGELRKVPGIERFTVVSVQALHAFYLRGNERVGASWMTKQDRDVAVADNIAYVDRVVDALDAEPAVEHPRAIVFAGFSQGASMAYRAAALGRHRAIGVIALGGDIPPEVKSSNSALPPVLIGAGDKETWFTAEKVDADVAFLKSRDVAVNVVRFSGGHEWTDEFRAKAGVWLRGIAVIS